MGETEGDRIRRIGVEEFVRRLKRLVTGDAQVSWFLGAGASKSSGIPLAGELTERWLHQLHAEAAPKVPFDEFVAETFPRFDPADVAASYSDVMTRLFQTAADRQEEIERLVARHDPGFGYATFARLLAHTGCGPKCNVVFTTNFDDLVADALYLYTRTRPLVVSHASLADFAASGRTRPTIIKLHGDAMLAPLNGEEELQELHESYKEVLDRHLRDRALIFLGYGGHDAGVTKALAALPKGSMARGIYWVGDRIPETDLGSWLRQRGDTFWVRHLDFDELMAVVLNVFDLPHPTADRFESLLKHYQATFSTLQGEVDSDEEIPDVVRSSVDSAREKFDSWFAVEAEAARYKHSNPDRAAQIYRQGLDVFPDSAELLNNYALLLTDMRDDVDALALAERHYRRALDLNPTNSMILANFANYLHDDRRDYDAAEHHYRRVLELDPTNPGALTNYANLLRNVRHDYDAAATLYRRSQESDPDVTINNVNYAGLLWGLGRQDEARAQMVEIDLGAAPRTLALEVSIYRLANDGLGDDARAEELGRLRSALIDGTRTRGWSFDLNVERAEIDGASAEELDLLRALAAVATDEEPIETLDRFPEWVPLRA